MSLPTFWIFPRNIRPTSTEPSLHRPQWSLALNGVYQQMPGSAANVVYPTVSGSFKAGTMTRPDEVTGTLNCVYYSERTLPLLSLADATEWSANYAVIKNANFLEVAVNRMADSDFSGNRRREILGELAYFKAFAYFRILCRYCEFWDEESEYGVVFRNEAPSVENAPMARSSVKDSYDYILSQLDIAVANTPQYTDLSKVNVKAAGALRAKVLFYAGRYNEAIRAVDDVVDTDAPLAETSYGGIFDNFGSTPEIYFARVFDKNDAGRSMRTSAFGDGSKTQGYWGPSVKFMDYVGDDPRTTAIYRNIPELLVNRNTQTLYDYQTCRKTWNQADNMPVIFSREAEPVSHQGRVALPHRSRHRRLLRARRQDTLTCRRDRGGTRLTRRAGGCYLPRVDDRDVV